MEAYPADRYIVAQHKKALGVLSTCNTSGTLDRKLESMTCSRGHLIPVFVSPQEPLHLKIRWPVLPEE